MFSAFYFLFIFYMCRSSFLSFLSFFFFLLLVFCCFFRCFLNHQQVSRLARFFLSISLILPLLTRDQRGNPKNIYGIYHDLNHARYDGVMDIFRQYYQVVLPNPFSLLEVLISYTESPYRASCTRRVYCCASDLECY